MTVQHIMLLELSEDAADQNQQALEKARALLAEIPGVLDVTAGRNFSDRTPNVTHAAIVTLENKQALQGYASHPKHIEALGLLKPFVKSTQAVDYES